MRRSFLALSLLLALGSAHAAGRITYHQAACDGCGEQRIELGRHSFCALSYVHSGGFSSACQVGGGPKGWFLKAIDPDRGETQACTAVCLDLEGDGEAGTPPPAAAPVTPAPPPPAAPVAPQRLGPYRSTFGDMTLTREGSRVTGRYTHRDGRIEGTLEGRVLTGRWTQSNGQGRVVLRFSADFSSFTGEWGYNDAPPDQSWTGQR